MSEQKVLEVRGVISSILDVESGTSKAGKEWKKQGFVIDTGNEYNPEVCFSVFGEDKIESLSKHNAGDEVNVSFNLSSREFNGKYYHNIDAWQIEKVGSTENVEEDVFGDTFEEPAF